MSEQPTMPAGGGNMLTRKYAGVPGYLWLAGAALIMYLIIRSRSSSSTSGTSGNTPNTNNGTATDSGTTTINPPNVTINAGSRGGNTMQQHNQNKQRQATPPPPPPPPPQHGTPNPQPTPPPPPPKTVTTSKKATYKKITVQPGQTLQSLAAQYHTTVEAIASAPGNVYVTGEVPGNKKVGQQLGTGAGLKTGMTLNIPVA
jgi:LysM repeat protein